MQWSLKKNPSCPTIKGIMPFQPRQVTDREIEKDPEKILFEYSLQLMEYRMSLKNSKGATTPSSKTRSKDAQSGHSTTLK